MDNKELKSLEHTLADVKAAQEYLALGLTKSEIARKVPSLGLKEEEISEESFSSFVKSIFDAIVKVLKTIWEAIKKIMLKIAGWFGFVGNEAEKVQANYAPSTQQSTIVVESVLDEASIAKLEQNSTAIKSLEAKVESLADMFKLHAETTKNNDQPIVVPGDLTESINRLTDALSKYRGVNVTVPDNLKSEKSEKTKELKNTDVDTTKVESVKPKETPKQTTVVEDKTKTKMANQEVASKIRYVLDEDNKQFSKYRAYFGYDDKLAVFDQKLITKNINLVKLLRQYSQEVNKVISKEVNKIVTNFLDGRTKIGPQGKEVTFEELLKDDNYKLDKFFVTKGNNNSNNNNTTTPNTKGAGSQEESWKLFVKYLLLAADAELLKVKSRLKFKDFVGNVGPGLAFTVNFGSDTRIPDDVTIDDIGGVLKSKYGIYTKNKDLKKGMFPDKGPEINYDKLNLTDQKTFTKETIQYSFTSQTSASLTSSSMEAYIKRLNDLTKEVENDIKNSIKEIDIGTSNLNKMALDLQKVIVKKLDEMGITKNEEQRGQISKGKSSNPFVKMLEDFFRKVVIIHNSVVNSYVSILKAILVTTNEQIKLLDYNKNKNSFLVIDF